MENIDNKRLHCLSLPLVCVASTIAQPNARSLVKALMLGARTKTPISSVNSTATTLCYDRYHGYSSWVQFQCFIKPYSTSFTIVWHPSLGLVPDMESDESKDCKRKRAAVFVTEQREDTVPVVPGALPLLGHSLQMASNSLHFIRQCKAKYGLLFRVRQPVNQEIYVVTGKLIIELLRMPENVVSLHQEVEYVFPMQRIIVSHYNNGKTDELSHHRIPFNTIAQKNYCEKGVTKFSLRVKEEIKQCLDEELQLQERGARKEVDIKSFLSKMQARTFCAAFVGSQSIDNKKLGPILSNIHNTIVRAAAVALAMIVPQIDKTRFSSGMDCALRFIKLFTGGSLARKQFNGFALHELACRPRLVEELRQEILKLGEDNITPDTIGSISLLDSFARETLRYHSNPLMNFHRVVQDVLFSNGKVVPKGSLIAVAQEEGHKDPSIAPETLNENNEQWTSQTITQKGYFSFGWAMHPCRGRQFVIMEFKLFIAELVMRYNISTQSGYDRGKDRSVLGSLKLFPKEPLIFERI
ncbi:cytochrome P450 [Zychaea mexicana]|uniref:cytochrome P450 n=1 Tax=Zychaea mexicana TaxID=64656 RepID=UPI0022FF1211|nr:cytochrome P450 [Zychaea mexicana]KAI9496458.1 cytochrome P450 [Zychaea mexicana]